MADARPVLTDAEREEHVRHLSTLSYACLDGPCDHPACYPDAMADATPTDHEVLYGARAWLYVLSGVCPECGADRFTSTTPPACAWCGFVPTPPLLESS